MPERSLYWCPVFKAGSSTWLHYLLDIAKMKKEEKEDLLSKHAGQPMNMIKPFTKKLSTLTYKKLMSPAGNVTAATPPPTSFIIVRHPFHRLVSAFRDKLERIHVNKLENDWYYNRYGKKIVKKHRKNALLKFGPTFFSAQNNFGAPVPVKNRPSADLPTFWEFVKYVIETSPSRMDEHWRPMENYCSVCTISYDNVILFEHMVEEGRLFRKMVSPDLKEKDVLQQWNQNPSGLSKDDLVNKYFDLLSPNDVVSLYKIYQFDFKLFGYTFRFRNMTFPL